MFGKNKNKIFIVRKFGEQYKKIDEIGIKEGEELIQYKEHKIPLPPQNPTTLFTEKISVLFFDLDKKEYLHFEKTELGLSTEWLDELFSRKIVSQLVKAVKKAVEQEKTNWDFIKNAIIYAVIFGVGYLAGNGGF